MLKLKLLGIDIAKNVFQLHGVDKNGKAILRKTLRRNELKKFIASLPICVIAMEACGGAHHWARQFSLLGHKVKLISAQFVKPFVKSNKNDAHDAQAICEAASRPDMRFVPIKKTDQQDIQCIHRVRERLINHRTALCNQIRGLLTEYGVVVVKGVMPLRKKLPEILEDAENELTPVIRELCAEFYTELLDIDQKIKSYDKKIQKIFEDHPICQKIEKIEGIGPITATALLIVLSDPTLFKNGRHFSAFLGLVPRQNSSGGKQKLLGISKRGERYLRQLLIHGARAVVSNCQKKEDARSTWLKELKIRRGSNRATVALANKNARIVWALAANDSIYQKAV